MLFFFGLGWRDFWAPVEPRYAEIARIMFDHNEWIVPRVNGELYTDKPILYFWLVLLAAKSFGGVNEWAVRLPAALGGIGFVWLTYLFGKEFFSARAGLLAAVVLATSIRVIWEARWAHIDMLFCFFFIVSIYFFARALFDRGSPKQALIAYVCMALATLAKGLIGVVLPGLLLLSFLIARRDWKILALARLPEGIALFIIVSAPWLVAVSYATGGQWLNDFLWVHHFERFTGGTGHRQPFYYYLTTLPVDLLPWTILAVPALLAYRPYTRIWREPVLLFFVLWFFAVFLFFSASDTKRELYLLPLLPVIALLIGNYLNDLSTGAISEPDNFRWFGSANFAILAVAGFSSLAVTWIIRREAFWWFAPGGVILAAGAALTAHFFWRREPLKAVQGGVATMTLLLISAVLWVFPYLENFKSRRPLSAEIRKVVPDSAPLYIYADAMHDFNFYLQREVVAVLSSPSEIENLLRAKRTSYVLVKNRDLKRLNRIARQWVVLTGSTGSTTWNLVEVKPAR